MKIVTHAGFEIIWELSHLSKPQRRVNIKHVIEWFWRRWRIL